MELLALMVILFLFVLVMIIDEARKRFERSIVCIAIADALERCPADKMDGAKHLAEMVASNLNARGWEIGKA